MDITQVKDIIGWLIGLLATSVVSLIVGVLAIVKAGKMLPKDLRAVDLENMNKEADVAEKYEGIAEKAAEKAIKLQARLDEMETNQKQLKLGHSDLQLQVNKQNEIIAEQEVQIYTLKCELNNYKMYTDALIKQLQDAQLVPVEMKTLATEDCDQTAKNIRKKNGNGAGTKK